MSNSFDTCFSDLKGKPSKDKQKKKKNHEMACMIIRLDVFKRDNKICFNFE